MTGLLLCCAAIKSAHAQPAAPSTPHNGRPQHVFIIILENKDFDETFGPQSDAPYLGHELRAEGRLLTNYYATGHHSLDNYISLVSGQAPTQETQGDCIPQAGYRFQDFVLTSPGLDRDGQVHGSGCVYPSSVLTIATQLERKGLIWGGYMEDMGRTCQHPVVNEPDDHVKAKPGDQYATRHNPFVYFHSLIDPPNPSLGETRRPSSCDLNDVPLRRLDADLTKVETTPNLVFITPNLCNDGHDPTNDGKDGHAVCIGGYLKSIDVFLRRFVPKILAAPAYTQSGILIITFDEAEIPDGSSCCGEPSGPNVKDPGLIDGGPGDRSGGGRIGALMLSPYVTPGSTDPTPYNHYSMLRGLEDLFELDHLGYAQKPAPTPFDEFLKQQ
jgi:hypothetical protein